MLVYGAGSGAAFFCLEPEPTQSGRSRSRLRDLGLPEPEPPKKVAAPQHWLLGYKVRNALTALYGREGTNRYSLS